MQITLYKLSNIGELVRDGRKANKMTQEQLAEKVGVSRSTMCNLEKNHIRVSFDTLILILKVLKLDLQLAAVDD